MSSCCLEYPQRGDMRSFPVEGKGSPDSAITSCIIILGKEYVLNFKIIKVS